MKNSWEILDYLSYYWSTYNGAMSMVGNPLWNSTVDAMEIIE